MQPTEILWWRILRADFRRMGVTHAQLAVEFNVAESTVNAWLRGSREPSVDTIKRLATKAGRSVAEIMAHDPWWVTNPEERDMLEAWRAMPQERRDAIRLLAKAQAGANTKSE